MINGFVNIQKEEEESLKSVWTHSLSLPLEKVFGLASCTHYLFLAWKNQYGLMDERSITLILILFKLLGFFFRHGIR
jgi:hypothetical protein